MVTNENDPQPERDTASVIAPPPLIYLAGLAVGFALEGLLPGASVPAAVRWVGGGVLVVAGLALLASFNTPSAERAQRSSRGSRRRPSSPPARTAWPATRPTWAWP